MRFFLCTIAHHNYLVQLLSILFHYDFCQFERCRKMLCHISYIGYLYFLTIGNIQCEISIKICNRSYSCSHYFYSSPNDRLFGLIQNNPFECFRILCYRRYNHYKSKKQTKTNSKYILKFHLYRFLDLYSF